MLKASVVGVLTFFVVGVAFKYIVILPRALHLQNNYAEKLTIVIPVLISIVLMAAWATDSLDEPDPHFPEAAVLTSLLAVIMLMLSSFNIVDSRDALVFVSTPSVIAVHAATFQFRHHSKWESVAVATALAATGGLGLVSVGKAMLFQKKA